ncbi:hypothetical protein BH10PLA1_BH10PLA1_07220 [soil metagenome]
MPLPDSAIANWNAAWDDRVGLWWQDGGGHTDAVAALPRVHSLPSAAARLLLAAEAKALQQIRASMVLAAIASAQVVDEGPCRGCFRWYIEEPKPFDTDAAFLAGMSLIALRLTHFNDLSPADQKTLTVMLGNLNVWFQRAIKQPAANCASKCLGDLVCCWLLLEINGLDDDGTLHNTMTDAAHYLTRQHWGWGEHLSDTYSGLCLDALSMLLLLAQRLPRDVRFAFQQLFDKLLAIEDQFDGPRVPAVRSHAFTTHPTHRNYREGVLAMGVRSASDMHASPSVRRDEIPPLGDRPALGSVLAGKRWHESVLGRHARGHDLRINCFGDTMAAARIEKDVRLGTMSHFPIMRGTDHRDWGLSWQCFPVAVAKPEGDWGFLQWETRAGQRTRAHPAEDKQSALAGNALTQTLNPPIIGQTYAIQQGGDTLILRLMPLVTSEWDSLHDRFRLIDSHAEIVDLAAKPTLAPLMWHQRSLIYADRSINIQCVPLFEGAKVESFKRDTFDGRHAHDWDVTLDRARLAGLRCVPILWGISLNGQVHAAPRMTIVNDPTGAPRTAEERMVQIHWVWDTARWDVVIDPLSPEPLREV